MNTLVKRWALVLAAAALAAGCGAPHGLSKQADAVASVAAEGALLAHAAAGGSSTRTFTGEHARALQKLVDGVRPAIEEPRLRRLADEVSASLGELAAAPDTAAAERLARALERNAAAARELAG